VAGYQVAEAARMNAPHGAGKSDRWTRTGSPQPFCPWMSSNCAGRG
jgi:hypothetical protein